MRIERVKEALRNIFPNYDLELFLHFYSFWKDLDLALWSYGEIRKDDYKAEKLILKEVLEGV